MLCKQPRLAPGKDAKMHNWLVGAASRRSLDQLTINNAARSLTHLRGQLGLRRQHGRGGRLRMHRRPRSQTENQLTLSSKSLLQGSHRKVLKESDIVLAMINIRHAVERDSRRHPSRPKHLWDLAQRRLRKNPEPLLPSVWTLDRDFNRSRVVVWVPIGQRASLSVPAWPMIVRPGGLHRAFGRHRSRRKGVQHLGEVDPEVLS